MQWGYHWSVRLCMWKEGRQLGGEGGEEHPAKFVSFVPKFFFNFSCEDGNDEDEDDNKGGRSYYRGLDLIMKLQYSVWPPEGPHAMHSEGVRVEPCLGNCSNRKSKKLFYVIRFVGNSTGIVQVFPSCVRAFNSIHIPRNNFPASKLKIAFFAMILPRNYWEIINPIFSTEGSWDGKKWSVFASAPFTFHFHFLFIPLIVTRRIMI